MNNTFIKIYGLPRCGTNYLEKIIKMNFNDVYLLGNILGWKHDIPQKHITIDWDGLNWDTPENQFKFFIGVYKKFKQNETEIRNSVEKDKIKYIFILKDPIDYLNSFSIYQKQFGDNVNLHIKTYINNYNIYCQKYYEFINEFKHKSIFIDYNNFEKHTISYNLNLIKDKFKLELKNENYINVDNVITPINSLQNIKYEKRKILLSDEEIKVIEQNIDYNIKNLLFNL